MQHDESKIHDKGAWVVYQLRRNYWWFWLACPQMREDLVAEFDLARLLAEMYGDARKAYNEMKCRIHALATQQGYVWTGSKWDGNRIGQMTPLQNHLVYGSPPPKSEVSCE